MQKKIFISIIVFSLFFIPIKVSGYSERMGNVGSYENINTMNNIPLSKDLLNYINKNCSEYGISFPLFLGILDVETGGSFSFNLVSSTDDLGLAQHNRKYIEYHCDLLGMNYERFNPFDPYDSVLLSIKLLTSYRQEFCREYQGENLTEYSLGCYNRGISGMKEWSRKYGLSTDYSKAVIKASEKYKEE